MLQRGDRAPAAGNALAEVAREDVRIDVYLRHALVAVVLLIVGLGGWLGMVQLSGAVVAGGKIAVKANSKSVQHLEGGMIAELAVRDGERVAQGQLLLRLDARQADETARGLGAEAAAKRAQLKLLKDELQDLEALAERRLVPRSRIARTRREYAQLEGEAGRIKAELARAEASRKRLDVLAPISGRVHALQVHTIGGVIAPGQEILKIVPTDGELIIEGAVQPGDIDQVALGHAVAIRLSSFNQRTTPELAGRVINVSADLADDKGQIHNHYLVHIAFNDGELARLGERRLVPGMPAEVFIQTESRTMIDYLLSPVFDQFRRALRED